ncbi:MAG: penicillin acylase family protein, partial [Ignavibacteriae bacterium]
MRKKIFGIGVTFIVVMMVLVVVGYFLVTRSFPKTSGTINVSGLSEEVKVYRDEYGVPHIFAQSEYDAFYTVGYVHAQDRLWQMELVRRAGQGRLSEVLGEPALQIDKMFHTLGLRRNAQNLARALDDDTRRALQAYADGINEYIRSHSGKYPVEFDMLNIEPDLWTIEHSLLVSRLMAWELNYSRWVDLLLAELVQRFGEEKAREIYPNWPDHAPLIIPKELKGKPIAGDLRPWFDAEGACRALLGIRALESGSNAWAISGVKTASGKPILANDP